MKSGHDLTEEEVFRILDILSSKATRAFFNGIVYAACLFFLGASWRGLLVGAVAVILFLASYGGRWIERGGFALIAVAMLVWLGVIPPAHDWQTNAETALSRLVGPSHN
jgi:hypothetical protein